MAEGSTRVPENAEGPYFVDSSCIDCDTCRCIAPEHFRRCDEMGYSYVYRQPGDADEVERAEEALDCCPVGAIGCSRPARAAGLAARGAGS
jgi:ferredoxin